MITIAFLMALAAPFQSQWRLPVEIEVMRDVEVQPSSALRRPGAELSKEKRGTLYVWRESKGFRIEKGRTFLMIKSEGDGEGACRIRVETKEYDLSSCPWLEGFSDHQADIFKVITKR